MPDVPSSIAAPGSLALRPELAQAPCKQRRRILLADDDAAFRTLLQMALAGDGYDVVAVKDGTELLERLSVSLSAGAAEDRFDVVVSDVRMPGWTGLNVLLSMRHQANPPPVVLITAFGDERLHEQAVKAGAIAVLDKPFELDDLRALVSRLMAA
jgi:CheY-like chemotaxis protein